MAPLNEQWAGVSRNYCAVHATTWTPMRCVAMQILSACEDGLVCIPYYFLHASIFRDHHYIDAVRAHVAPTSSSRPLPPRTAVRP